MKTGQLFRTFLLLTCVMLIIPACISNGEKNSDSPLYTMPVYEEGGFEVGTPADAGLEETLIMDLLKDIRSKKFKNIHSLYVVRNNKLVVAEDFKTRLSHVDKWVGNDDIKVHCAMSISKSIVSILTGIAIDQGLIDSTSDKVYDYFPDYQPIKEPDPRKALMTIDDALTMRHGLEWDEESAPYTSPKNSFTSIIATKDWARSTLNKPMVNDPGTVFAYSSGISHTMGTIISRVSEMGLDEYANKNLFEPLGIKKSIWSRSPSGMCDDVYLTSRAMAKIGQLTLDKGVWKGERIVSESWIDATIKWTEQVYTRLGYARFWWKINYRVKGVQYEATVAWGYGGQYIFVIPDANLVVVATSGNYHSSPLAEQPFHMVGDYILPAINDK